MQAGLTEQAAGVGYRRPGSRGIVAACVISLPVSALLAIIGLMDRPELAMWGLAVLVSWAVAVTLYAVVDRVVMRPAGTGGAT